MSLAELRLKNCYSRWYPLKEIPEQVRLVSEEKRFKAVPAGRRSGKTERAKRYLAKQAMTKKGLYFAAAPTREQAKKIWWEDLKLMTFEPLHRKEPAVTSLILFLANGSEIHVIGLDKPQRIEGQPWTGGVIDEIADLKPEAWAENIYPALSTFNPMMPEFRPWAWLIGVPDGLNHFFDICERAKTDPEWGLYHWTSDQVLPKDMIEAAMRAMSKKQFNQEYRASFETASGLVYSDFDIALNSTDESINPDHPLTWTHDFNYTPLSSAIIQERNGKILVLDEIVLESAVAQNTADEFVQRFRNHRNKSVNLFGDYSGTAGEVHNQSSNYKVIENTLRRNGWTVTRKVRPNPAIIDGQNSLRALICNAMGERKFFVNPKCRYSKSGLSRVQFKKGSTFQEEETEFQHITTAFRYFAHAKYPVTIESAYDDRSVHVMRF